MRRRPMVPRSYGHVLLNHCAHDASDNDRSPRICVTCSCVPCCSQICCSLGAGVECELAPPVWGSRPMCARAQLCTHCARIGIARGVCVPMGRFEQGWRVSLECVCGFQKAPATLDTPSGVCHHRGLWQLEPPRHGHAPPRGGGSRSRCGGKARRSRRRDV